MLAWVVAFVGHIVFGEGIKVCTQKNKGNGPRPTSLNNIRCFFGLVGYYRMFV